jgi:RNA polymerase sigma-70 factor (ECF subfamily)
MMTGMAVEGLEPPAAGAVGPVADGAAFDAFFLREYRPLVGLLLALTGDLAVAEDLAQEALLRALRRWDRVAGLDKPGAWTRRVAINLALSWRRRRRSERRAVTRVAAAPIAPVPPPDVDQFWAAVRSLPRRQAAAIALRYVDDLSIAEIADVLECAPGTAKAHLHAGRQALAKRLGADGSEES